MFELLKKLFVRKTKTVEPTSSVQLLGAVMQDEATLAQLPHFDEIVASARPVDWKPLDVQKLPDYPISDQDGSGSCVAQTMALIASILYFKISNTWVKFSPKWFYRQRTNKGQGMWYTDASGLMANVGALPDVFMPSEKLNEEQMNTGEITAILKDVARNFKIDKDLVLLPAGDIETVASTMQTTGKPLMLWWKFGPGEWDKVPHIVGTATPYVHSTTGLAPAKEGEMTFGLYEGEKAIVMQDSWGQNLGTINGKRIIKESFFKTRNILAAYPIKFRFEGGTINKPRYDGTVTSLQDCLKYDGDFPTNVDSTGVYGSVTTAAVRKFQTKYGIEPLGIVGPKTKAKLSELFS